MRSTNAIVVAGALAAGVLVSPAAPAVAQCSPGRVTVSNALQLTSAAGNACDSTIIVQGQIALAPSFRLAPGQALVGSNTSGPARIAFLPGVDGVQISQDNTVENLQLKATSTKRAIFNDTSVTTLGQTVLRNLVTTGEVQLLADKSVHGGGVTVNGLNVTSADTSLQTGLTGTFFGSKLEAMQGAFTLWNRQTDPADIVQADLRGISVGTASDPIVGSGIFVSGGLIPNVTTENVRAFGSYLSSESTNPTVGSVHVSGYQLGEIHTAGNPEMAVAVPISNVGGTLVQTLQGLPLLGSTVAGTAQQVLDSATVIGTIGVFNGPAVVSDDGLYVAGPVTTTGAIAGAFNIYSNLSRLVVDQGVTTYGPDGFGVVSWPHVGQIVMHKPLETFGAGARAFNTYAGQVDSADFASIITHGDGAVGVDTFVPMNILIVRNGIHTYGGSGNSLVLGQFVSLPANAIRATELAGRYAQITAGGPIMTSSAGIPAVQLGPGNTISSLCANEGVETAAATTNPFNTQGQATITCDSPQSTPFAPVASACVSTSTLVFNIGALATSPITEARVYVNGTLVRDIQGSNVTAATLNNLPNGAFTLGVQTSGATTAPVNYTRAYYGCTG